MSAGQGAPRLKPLPRRFAHRGHSGFSLLELIVALVVFAFAFAVLMEVAGTGLRAARRSADYTQAALHAQSLLDALGVGEKLDTGADSGRFDERFRWELDVREAEDPASWNGLFEQVAVDLYQVELTVRWDEGRIERSARFATLRARQPGLDAGIGQ